MALPFHLGVSHLCAGWAGVGGGWGERDVELEVDPEDEPEELLGITGAGIDRKGHAADEDDEPLETGSKVPQDVSRTASL